MKRNRRIKRSRLQTIYVRTRSVTKDGEGVPIETYAEAYEKQAELWPAGEHRQVETYGDRITGISNMRVQGAYEVNAGASEGITFADGSTLKPGDGICVDRAADEAPDYRVLTITPYRPVRLEIERV